MQKDQIKVFYDGACILCSKEIEHYQKIDKKNAIQFIDISLPGFDAATEQLDPQKVNQELHVKKGTEIYTGIDSFNTIWTALDVLKPLQIATQTPFIRQALKACYVIFAYGIRPYLPKKDCENGLCQK